MKQKPRKHPRDDFLCFYDEHYLTYWALSHPSLLDNMLDYYAVKERALQTPVVNFTIVHDTPKPIFPEFSEN